MITEVAITINNISSAASLYLLALWSQMGLMMTAMTDEYGTLME
jgi:hypothetical protein